MNAAISAVINHEMGYFKAATQFGVPQTTLERYVKKEQTNPGVGVVKSMGRFKNVFTDQQENELVQYLMTMEERLFGLTAKELRSLAFQLAERNDCANPFNKSEEIAGVGWFNAFMKRHPEISLRKPEATSAARAMDFNKVAVAKFFDILRGVVDKHCLTAEKIFNVDETGITVNPKGHSRVISQKGRRQVGTVTSAERGETVTAEICFSAAGAYLPPMLISQRKQMQQEFQIGLPPGSWAEVEDKGWITKESFLSWFKKFVTFSGASKQSPVLLLLDGHASHTKNLQLIDTAREKGVTLLCFPPHCSHRLQPLNVSFTKPLSKYYENEVRKWLCSHPGKVVMLFHITSLFGSAYLKAATMLTAINGFRKTGIWPVDQNVFSEADFLPSDPTDISLRSDSPRTTQPLQVAVTDEPQAGCSSSTVAEPETQLPVLLAGTSRESRSTIGLSAFLNCSPENILPVPKVVQGEKRTKRKRGTTAIVTASPYKEELAEAQKQATKKINTARMPKCLRLNEQKKKTKKHVTSVHLKCASENEASQDDDTECLYCYDLYSNSSEGWIRCSRCSKWAHNSCAGVDSDDDEVVHICEG